MKISGVDLDRIIAYISRAQLARHRACLATLQALLFLMATGKGRKTYWCKPSVQKIADLVGRTRQQTHVHLRILESAGLIKRVRRGKNGRKLSNIYKPGDVLVAVIYHLKKEAYHEKRRSRA